jgi:hypothetical protein
VCSPPISCNSFAQSFGPFLERVVFMEILVILGVVIAAIPLSQT